MGKAYRKQQEQLVKDQIARTGREDALAASNAAIQTGERAKAEPYVASLEQVAPGRMSPYTAATYAAAKNNIANTYAGLRETAQRVLNQRGFGRAPSGMTVSAMNAANEGEANANTGAYRGALADTQAGKNLALNYRTNTQNMYNPLPAMSVANQGAGEASGMNVARSQMGSTLGDVASGIGVIAGGVNTALNPASGFMRLAQRVGPMQGINLSGPAGNPSSYSSGYGR